MRNNKLVLCCFVIFCLLFSMPSCRKEAEPLSRKYFDYFDTVSTVYDYSDDGEDAFEKNCDDIAEMLEKYHKLFDIYNEYEGMNNLCTVNKNAGGEALMVDRELVDFLLYAKNLYLLTGGEMNVMMGSVLSLWHDCREDASKGDPRVPDNALLLEAAKHTSIDSLEIDGENLTVRISDEFAALDVGAVGKGYVAEKIAQMLEDREAGGYVLDIGGNIRMIGEKSSGDGWITGIKHPTNNGEYVKRLKLSDISCVTSGNYERYFELDGKKYHHIIDKDTLFPSEHFASVTVICKDSALADALSTALFCMDRAAGERLADSIGGVEVVWVTNDGQIYSTDRIADWEVSE